RYKNRLVECSPPSSTINAKKEGCLSLLALASSCTVAADDAARLCIHHETNASDASNSYISKMSTNITNIKERSIRLTPNGDSQIRNYSHVEDGDDDDEHSDSSTTAFSASSCWSPESSSTSPGSIAAAIAVGGGGSHQNIHQNQQQQPQNSGHSEQSKVVNSHNEYAHSFSGRRRYHSTIASSSTTLSP
ncbi:hypothetical protein BLA29_012162, partial [Euroglyphus maynei]